VKVRYSEKSDVNALTTIVLIWREETNLDVFGMEFRLNEALNDLRQLVLNDKSELLLLIDERMETKKVVGFMGITIFKSPVGEQEIANEHYWYVMPEHRGIGSIKLLKKAREWAIKKGCSHFMINASNMASDYHNKMCGLYEKLGMMKFETTYIENLDEGG